MPPKRCLSEDSEGLFFSAVYGLIAADSFRAAFANVARIDFLKAVGYNSTTLRNGALGVAPQFEGIASEDGSYDLQQITCNDEADGVAFTILDAAGLDTGYISWTIWYDPMWTFTNYEKCWIDEYGQKVEGKSIRPGDGLWVSGKNADQVFTCSGQVGKKDVSVVLRNGALMTGNPSPTPIDLQDIICNDAADGVAFTILDDAGLDTGYISWTIWYDPMWTFTNYEKCWIDEYGTKIEGMTINPGQGLWISGKVDPADPAHPDPTVDQIVTFPGLSDL